MPGHLQEGFGCVVTNRFDQLFDDEDDPFDVLKQAEKKKMDATAPGAAKTAAQVTKQPKKESQKERKIQVSEKEETQAPVPLKKDGMKKMGRRPEQQGQTGFQQQGGQGEGRPPADRRPERRPPRERRFDKPADEKPAEGGEFSVENSLKAEEKRGGSGSHNWGTVKDELSELDQSNVTEDTPEGEEHPPNDSENKENEVEDAKEEGPKEMTLDEWRAQQSKERAKVEFNIRKANEGADWNKGYVLHKSKAEDSSVDDASGDHHFRKLANDITSQLEINFGDLGRPGRGRGGPRGGRGGRGAPATRPPRERRPDKVQSLCVFDLQVGGVSVPNVDDPEAFPALA
ncbi:hypothetical protein cypCar_00017261 [Cyprinus carpio]|nr:hypothetical protein cypCar_00017261 [Cyprinus carpio]